MNSQFVPHPLAQELKELGFDQKCILCYYDGELENPMIETWPNNNSYLAKEHSQHGECISAPVYQQAIQFLTPMLSKVKGTYRVIVIQATGEYWLQERVGYGMDGYFKGISDETNEDCIRQLIKVIKYGEKY